MKYGRATCLPHKGGGVPLNALPKHTTRKLAGLFSTLFLFMLSAKQGSCEYHFLKSFGMTRLRNEPQVYRLQCGRSNHCTIAPVSTLFVSRTGGVPSHLNFSTHGLPRFPPRNLCSLVTLAVFTLVYAATNEHSLLLSSCLSWQN